MKIKSVLCEIEDDECLVRFPFEAFITHLVTAINDSNGLGIRSERWSKEQMKQIMKKHPLPKDGYYPSDFK